MVPNDTEAVPTEAFKNNKFYFVGSVDMAPSRKSRTHNNRQDFGFSRRGGDSKCR